MEKQKRWQFYLILAVLILTLYNILPTVFYYSRPLKSAIDLPRAEAVGASALARAQSLENDSIAWLESFSKLLHVKPTSIKLNSESPGLIDVTFADSKAADTFRKFLPKAGSLISFAPAQLSLFQGASDTQDKVTVARQINIGLNAQDAKTLFHFIPKLDANGAISPEYRELANDRVKQIAQSFAGPSKTAEQLKALPQSGNNPASDVAAVALAKEIVEMEEVIGKGSPAIAKRYYSTFAQTEKGSPDALLQKFTSYADGLTSRLTTERAALLEEQKALKEKGVPLSHAQELSLSVLDHQKKSLESALAIIKKNAGSFKAAKKSLSYNEIAKTLANSSSQDSVQILNLEGRDPFVEALLIDLNQGTISLKFFADVQTLRLSTQKTEALAFQKDRLNQLIINKIAKVNQQADENLIPNDETFTLTLNTLTDSQSFLTLDLGKLAEKQAEQIKKELSAGWTPKHIDLSPSAYPVLDNVAFKKLKPEEQKLGLIVFAPSASEGTPEEGFRMGSIYVIARGLNAIAEKHQGTPDSESSKQFMADFNQLKALLQQNGFIGYPAASYGMAQKFSKDFIFELSDYYSHLLQATREHFTVKGSKRFAVLDFTDVEQRLLALNKIDDLAQQDLLKWKEEYSSAQVDLNATSKYLVPKPTKNVYWQNLTLSFVKYFRGDERKILKWGLDLSGGKTVRIGLRDHNNRTVTNPDDIKQVVNELYTRINKMGVAERNIHIENNNIILDFPGSQGLSASELVKASAMYFHIVNEKFSSPNSALKDTVNQFLQNVWNEAVVTNRKDIESINEIAWHHLGEQASDTQNPKPMSEIAKLLWDNGLRIDNPKERSLSSSFNDTLSSVAVLRGNDFMEWDGQSHPLLFVFHNYALEGANLENIHVSYDPSKGNTLNFGVKSAYERSQERQGNPRDDFYAWTSQFAKEQITGTPKEAYTGGRGFRMAVILNGHVVTKPNLEAPLREGGLITGRFTQREISQLAADLKAGSLSFTPKILSEQNVSPELGKEERRSGIVASLVAVALVVVAMIGYYHFAGVVATVAVLLNLLIMWGVLQNLGAALTLPTIAGIVLTIGMAVDANVLVFERIREEFAKTRRIASSIQAGYSKAFSAIFDSNITTILAAVILIQFDSGPIKGFAVSLIVGIVSSMFTALFMTRYYFAGWVKNPAHKELKMSQFIGSAHFNFMAQTKKALVISLVVMAVGTYLFISQRNTMLGMDFTGGYSLVTDLKEKDTQKQDYRLLVADALLASGATRNDIQVRELSRPSQVKIQLGISMEEKDHPFYNMPEETKDIVATYPYETNPRLTWVVKALAARGLEIQPSQLDTLDRDWSVMSGQLSQTMRNNAIMALAIALVSILIYITIRFEINFALGAVVGLIHDVIITLGILAMFHKLGFAVQIDLQVIGAIMTIIGYSLNDTIIVFDRIREDTKIYRKMPFVELINQSLNVTLSRTLMTSGTTLLVLLALVILGGKTIFAFSLVMTIGVLIGTLSSLFIASPVMLYFHNRSLEKRSKAEVGQT